MKTEVETLRTERDALRLEVEAVWLKNENLMGNLRIEGNRLEEMARQRDDLLVALLELLKCNHKLGAISKPVADQARAVIARLEGRSA